MIVIKNPMNHAILNVVYVKPNLITVYNVLK